MQKNIKSGRVWRHRVRGLGKESRRRIRKRRRRVIIGELEGEIYGDK